MGPWFRFLVLAVVVTLPGCRDGGLPAPDVVARIGGHDLPYADFEAYLRDNAVDSRTGLSSEVLSSLFDQYLDEVLLGRLAADEGFADQRTSRQQAVEALVEASLEGDISSDDVAVFYESHRSEFVREETVVLRQILVEDRSVAQRAREAIRAGMPFEEAASRFSQGPRAQLGGMQGELARGDLPPSMADVIFSLDAGETSEIISADYGFHLFQVVDRRPAAVPELDEVGDAIAERLRHQRRSRVVAQLVEKARNSYNTSIYARNLPFNYSGFRR